jgi:gluconate 2-dehydrogenase gamma chain
MSQENSGAPKFGRRDFLRVVSVAGVASALPAAGLPAQAADSMSMKMPEPADQPSPGLLFFNPDEGAAVTAIVDVLIPSDDVGPGGVEAGVVTYIDRQLGGAYGGGARLYLEGPFQEGTPQQGYQLRFTPAELVRLGLADLDAYAKAGKGDVFANLTADDQNAILKDMDGGKAEFATVPAKTVFDHLYALVQEGYFGDPIYGGNQGKAVWKMIGFPGVAGMYTDLIDEFRNKPYDNDPQSIQDFA